MSAPTPVQEPTWRRGGALASWSFRAPEGRAAMAQRIVATLTALGDFARATICSLTTVSEGEDAVRVDAREDAIRGAFAEHADVAEAEIDLDLLIDLGSGSEREPEGAVLWVSVDDAGTGPLRLQLSIHADIYAAKSYSADGDNRRLAALNGPRLAGFLDRLVALGWRFDAVYAPGYRDQVGPRGFAPPEPTPDPPPEADALLAAVEGYVEAFLTGDGTAPARTRLEAAVERWRAAGAPAVRLPGGLDPGDGPEIAALLRRVEDWLGGDEAAGDALARWADAQEAPAREAAAAERAARVKTDLRSGVRAALARAGFRPGAGRAGRDGQSGDDT